MIGWECFPTLGWGGMNPTQSLVDAFEDKDGAPISKSTIYNEKDPFKIATLVWKSMYFMTEKKCMVLQLKSNR